MQTSGLRDLLFTSESLKESIQPKPRLDNSFNPCQPKNVWKRRSRLQTPKCQSYPTPLLRQPLVLWGYTRTFVFLPFTATIFAGSPTGNEHSAAFSSASLSLLLPKLLLSHLRLGFYFPIRWLASNCFLLTYHIPGKTPFPELLFDFTRPHRETQAAPCHRPARGVYQARHGPTQHSSEPHRLQLHSLAPLREDKRGNPPVICNRRRRLQDERGPPYPPGSLSVQNKAQAEPNPPRPNAEPISPLSAPGQQFVTLPSPRQPPR